MEVSVVINYCSIDNKFIDHTIQQCQLFSDDIIVSSLTHLFTGEMEDRSYLKELKNKYPTVRFITNNYEGQPPFPRFYNCVERWNGIGYSIKDYVMLLDADEVPEGELVKSYLQEVDITPYDVITFDCYWYFREPIYRSKKTEITGYLFKKNIITKGLIFTNGDRWGYMNPQLRLFPFENQRYQGQILFHHYSWVRDKEGLLMKTRNFGHRDERDWVSLIEEEFSHSFNGIDFVHGYEYEEVPNRFEIKV